MEEQLATHHRESDRRGGRMNSNVSDERADEVTDPEALDGDACERSVSDAGPAGEPDWSVLDADELASLDAALRAGDDDAVVAALEAVYAPGEFFKPGGGWGGSEAPARRAERIGHANRLTTTSTKQQRPSNPGSDHDVDNKTAFAVDLSNGSSPTAQMDRTARQIAAAAGIGSYNFGFREVVYRPHRMRLQLIYRAANHYNHVHAGFKRT